MDLLGGCEAARRALQLDKGRWATSATVRCGFMATPWRNRAIQGRVLHTPPPFRRDWPPNFAVGGGRRAVSCLPSTVPVQCLLELGPISWLWASRSPGPTCLVISSDACPC